MREVRTAQASSFDVYSQHKFSDFLSDLSRVLDGHPEILVRLEEDLLTDGARSTGRKGLSVESIFRCMLLKQITGVSYEMLAFHLADSSSYRSFARLDGECRPGKSALSGNIRRLRARTLQAVFELLGVAAFEQGLMEVDCLRVDSTVVNSNIAPPSDSRSLDDGIRVLSRFFAKSRDCTGVKLRLTDYRKPSRSLAARIFYGKKAEKDELYAELIPLARRVVKQSEKAIGQVQQPCHLSALSQPWIDRVMYYRELLERVIGQAERRVFHGEKVPAKHSGKAKTASWRLSGRP